MPAFGVIGDDKLLIALLQSQRMTVALARSVQNLIDNDRDKANASIESVVELAEEAQNYLMALGKDLGVKFDG